ncbi:MAG: DUF4834 family protein [Bacteroidota bacterium]
MGFLKAILILLLVYYLVKLLFRMFAPRLFSYAAKKTENHFKERFGEFSQGNGNVQGQVGDISIEKGPSRKKSSSKDVGEYIDFEEVD